MNRNSTEPEAYIVHDPTGINRGRFFDYHEAVRKAYELNKADGRKWYVTKERKFREKFLLPNAEGVMRRQFNFINNGLRFV